MKFTKKYVLFDNEFELKFDVVDRSDIVFSYYYRKITVTIDSTSNVYYHSEHKFEPRDHKELGAILDEIETHIISDLTDRLEKIKYEAECEVIQAQWHKYFVDRCVNKSSEDFSNNENIETKK